MDEVSIYRLSERAITLAWPAQISREINDWVVRTDQLVRGKPFRGWIENVPSYHTLTVYYDPVLLELSVNEYLLSMAKEARTGGNPRGRLVEVPVYYDAARAPDLPLAAQLLGLSVDELIQLHSGQSYQVFMIGFMPGFPYMGILPDRLVLPRKAVPEKKVLAGTVAIAGKQTGIYPFESPGGWYGIGWTPVRMFENESSMLEPGDEVKFIPQWG